MNNKRQKCLFRPPSQTKSIDWAILSKKLKKRLNLPFDSYFVSCLYEGKFRGYFGFFLSNLLVSNV